MLVHLGQVCRRSPTRRQCRKWSRGWYQHHQLEIAVLAAEDAAARQAAEGRASAAEAELAELRARLRGTLGKPSE